MKWWQSNPARFEIEKRLLARHHRSVKIVIEKGTMYVIKPYRSGKRRYMIEGKFDAHHPYAPMRFFIREPKITDSPPHSFSDGQLCLHGSGDTGPHTTAKVFLDWAIQWIRTYEKWQTTGTWPKTNRTRKGARK